MTAEYYVQAGTVTIDGREYELVREKDASVPYKQQWEAESPWQDGEPHMVSQKSFSWHLGGFKSHAIIESQIDRSLVYLPTAARADRASIDASEYGVNTDARWPFRLVPAPAINTLTLTGNSGGLNWIWRTNAWTGVDPMAWCCSLSGYAYYSTSLFGAGLLMNVAYQSVSDAPRMGLQWQNYFLLTTNTNKKIFKLSGSSLLGYPTGSGTTTQWTPSAGANWQNVGAADITDATYNTDSVAGHIDLFAHTATGVSAAAGISQVTLTMTVRRTVTGGTNPTMRAVLRIGGVNYFQTAQQIANTTTYAAYAFVWNNSPATNLPFTKAELDAAEIGYELTVAPGAGVIRVTQLTLSALMSDWTTTDALADWLAIGPRRMFKVYNDGTSITLKNIIPGLDPTVEANWGDSVVIPGADLTGSKVPLVSFQKTAIVATEKGIFGVDSDGSGIRIIERITYSPLTMATQDPWLYISHAFGLSRWVPGLVESTGIEREILNESSIKGVMNAIAYKGNWVFASLTPPSGNAQILVGRDVRSGETSLGPMIWDTFIDTGYADTLYCLLVDQFYGFFFLAFVQNNNLAYCLFPSTGGAPDIDATFYTFALTGTRYTVRYRFNDFRNKSFYKFLIKCKNITANIYWEIAYAIDGGSWNTIDVNSANMKVTSDGLTEFILPTSAVGIEIQYRFTYTSNDSTQRAWIEYFEPFAVPQSHKIPILSFFLRLDSNIRHTSGIEDRTSTVQLSDLTTLIESPSPILATGPFGEGINLYPKQVSVALVETLDSNFPPSYIVQFISQVRE